MSKLLYHTVLTSFFILVVVQSIIYFDINVYAQGSEALKLKVYVGPAKVLADNRAYGCIFVQLLDSKNNPAKAVENVTVYLSSSNTYVGSVDPVVVIPKRSSYTIAQFYSTYTPGTTTITATASGFATVQASVTTVGPIPSKLAVYCLPPVLPADGRAYEAIIVQLQDASGAPAKAPIGDVNVTLSSSNVEVGTVPANVTIKAGDTYAKVTFQTTSVAGSTTITAMASGYSTGQTTVKTESVGEAPAKLKVYVGPPKVPAEGFAYDIIAVQLQDSKGKMARALEDLEVYLSSSNLATGAVNSTLVVNKGETYAIAKFYSTYKSGSTEITAASPDYESGKASVTTVGPVPSKLAVFCAPSVLPADGQPYDAVIVQLQDASGTPARDPVGNVTVGLFSSKPEVGDVDPQLVIPFGETFAVAKFYSTCTGGKTDITAQTPGYTTAKATMTTYASEQFTLKVSAAADPDKIVSGEQTTLKINVSYDLGPVIGAKIKLSSDIGGNFSSVIDERNGLYLCTFTAPTVILKSFCTISINASKPGWPSALGKVKITISPAQAGKLEVYVKDLDGNPVSGALVTLILKPSGINPVTRTTDSQGRVLFDGVLAGSYDIRISKDGYQPETEQGVTVSAGQTTMCTVPISRIEGGGSIIDFLTSPLMIFAIIVGISIIVAIIIVVRRRGEEEM
ncbi:MAG: carboxypeptidase regulatory-like domain-containing protein [Candidatus Bathyarchaeia archaeon]